MTLPPRAVAVLLCIAAVAGCGSASSGGSAARHAAAASPAATTSSPAATPAPTVRPLPAHVLLHVAAIRQLPELPNGCEATSLAMLLASVGHPVSKLTVARLQPRDPTPAGYAGGSSFYDVRRWGDPEVGFVGSVYGRGIGYGIYHRPLAALVDRLLPGRAVDLTRHRFTDLLRRVADGVPVLVWDTTTFQPTDDWVTWTAHGRRVRATTYEHAVLLVGYDGSHVYVNNPLTGAAAQRVPRAPFVAAWKQLGRQALTVSGGR